MNLVNQTTKDKMQMAIAWAMPRWLVKWCAVRLIAYATQGKYSTQNVPALSAMDALKRWETKSETKEGRE
jgi:hypothetical protein